MANESKDSSNSPFGIPGAGNLHDMMESMQKAWGFPGAQPMAPTLDLDEIDQRLKDLNAVAQWLALNQNMLQSSIQALQVQRATIVAIRSFSGDAEASGEGAASLNPIELMQAFSQAFTREQATSDAASGDATPPPGAGLDPQQWWAMLQQQFAQVAGAALNTADQTPAKPAKRKAKPRSKPAKG